MKLLLCFLSICTIAYGYHDQDNSNKDGEKTYYKKGYRYHKNGWNYVHIEGTPYERGFQHGYLTSDIYKKNLRCLSSLIYETEGMTYEYFVNEAVKMQKDKIPEELIEEMQGIADGLTKAGVPTTLDEIIGWNAFLEITENWWPYVKSDYVKNLSNKNKKNNGRCSAFVATGKATKDGKIVIAHSSFDYFWTGQNNNYILDIVPDKGHKVIMQGTACYVYSGTDFFINSKGLVGVETTIAGFNSYDANGIPYFVRTRLAMQYSDNIDQFIETMNKGNNGGIAATWLLGDTNTNEIAKFEQGLYFQDVQKKNDGYWFGCNVVDDPRIRNLECDEAGYNDIRTETGGRRVRWPILLDQYFGRIDIKSGETMMADHYDVYSKRHSPGANTICCHSDVDPRAHMSSQSASNPYPYMPKGCYDGIVTDATLVKEMKFCARWGRACGIPFMVKPFMAKHPQWKWQEKYLVDRPRQPWTLFSSTK